MFFFLIYSTVTDMIDIVDFKQDQEEKDIFEEKKSKGFDELIKELDEEEDKNESNLFISLENLTELQKDYNVLYIQHETFNFPLLFKFILHVILTLLCHVYLFFIIPMQGNKNANYSYICDINAGKTCNDMSTNIFLLLIYIFYTIYLYFSSLQIKEGYVDLKITSIFKKQKSLLSELLNNVYRKIPFFYELKLFLDWSCTPTSLTLFQWNKCESIYDILFSTYSSMRYYNKKKVGIKISLTNKLLL